MFHLDEIRGVLWLRRIALALEKQNELSEKFLELKTNEWATEHIKPIPKKMELGTMDPEEVSKRYLQQLEAEREGIDLDDAH